GVTDGASRVLLLTDIASRTPVMIDRTNARAILTGDGGPNPRLDYLRGRDPIREGDRLLTSGDGGVVPRGLPVGTAVRGLDGRWRVVLASDRAPIDFVRILLFEDFTQVVNLKQLSATPTPPPTPGPGMPKSPEAAADAPAVAEPAAPPPAARPVAPKAKPSDEAAAKSPADKKPAADKKPGDAARAGTSKPSAAKTETTKTETAKPGGTPKPPAKPKPKAPPADGGQG
ncbi:rod shape-determining protein MreC, partial [Phenylobacterium sp.]|uniref:rod shape-determining protein MreC n=1 Tax=Phenylobacterium sp. TaxID=1871053 RepID=UPI003422993B